MACSYPATNYGFSSSYFSSTVINFGRNTSNYNNRANKCRFKIPALMCDLLGKLSQAYALQGEADAASSSSGDPSSGGGSSYDYSAIRSIAATLNSEIPSFINILEGGEYIEKFIREDYETYRRHQEELNCDIQAMWAELVILLRDGTADALIVVNKLNTFIRAVDQAIDDLANAGVSTTNNPYGAAGYQPRDNSTQVIGFGTSSHNNDMSWLNAIKNLLCGDYKHSLNFGLPRLPKIPNFQMPNLDLNVNLNLKIDSCLAKYLPPMFDRKNQLGVLQIGRDKASFLGKIINHAQGPLGKLGDMAGRAGQAIQKVSDTLNTAIGHINNAIGQIESALNAAYSAVLGGITSGLSAMANAIGGAVGNALSFFKLLEGTVGKATGLFQDLAYAISMTYGVAVGAVGFFNTIRRSFGNSFKAFYDGIRSIGNNLKTLKDQLQTNNPLDDFTLINQSQNDKLKKAIDDLLGLAEKSNSDAYKYITQVQMFQEHITGTVDYTYQAPKLNFRNPNFITTKPHCKCIYAGHQRTCGINLGDITQDTSPIDAQLTGLEQIEVNLTESGNDTSSVVAEGCVLENMRLLHYHEMIKEGYSTYYANKFANDRAVNDVVHKMVWNGWLNEDCECPNPYIGVEPKSTRKYRQELITKCLNRDAIDCDFAKIALAEETLSQITDEYDFNIVLSAVNRVCFGSDFDCTIPADPELAYQTTTPAPTIVSQTPEDQAYKMVIPTMDYTLEMNSLDKYVLEGFRKLETIDGVNYYCDIFVITIKHTGTTINPDGTAMSFISYERKELKYAYRIIDDAYIDERLMGYLSSPRDSFNKIMRNYLKENYIDLRIFCGGSEINHLYFQNRCELNEYLEQCSKVNLYDIVVNNELDTACYKATINKKAQTITINSKISCDVVTIPIPESLKDKPVIEDDPSDNISKGSAICDDLIEYLITEDTIISQYLKRKGMDLADHTTYEYVRYILLPSNEHLYWSALEVCETGRYWEFGVDDPYIDVNPKPSDNSGVGNTLEEPVAIVTYPNISGSSVILPQSAIDYVPAELIQRPSGEGAIHIDVGLADTPIEGYSPAEVHYKGSEAIYISTIFGSSRDEIVVKHNEDIVYRRPMKRLVYTVNGAQVIQLL